MISCTPSFVPLAVSASPKPDRIVTLIGDSVPVAEVFDTEEWEPVYNIRVADFHTYFVGHSGIWVHNIKAPNAELESGIEREE